MNKITGCGRGTVQSSKLAEKTLTPALSQGERELRGGLKLHKLHKCIVSDSDATRCGTMTCGDFCLWRKNLRYPCISGTSRPRAAAWLATPRRALNRRLWGAGRGWRCVFPRQPSPGSDGQPQSSDNAMVGLIRLILLVATRRRYFAASRVMVMT